MYKSSFPGVLQEFINIVEISSALHGINNATITVHENNNNALLLVTNENITSHTRHYKLVLLLGTGGERSYQGC